MNNKINQIWSDVNDIYNAWDDGKIDSKTFDIHMRSLCKNYLKGEK